MKELLHDDTAWLGETTTPAAPQVDTNRAVIGDVEEDALTNLNAWIAQHGLPPGESNYDFSDASGAQVAVFDLAWPNGIQEELSQPVAVLLNAEAETIVVASQAGFQCFSNINAFQCYVKERILGEFSGY